MPETPSLLLEDLKMSSEQILVTLSEIIGVNTLFVAVNDSATNFILKAFNRDEILAEEGNLPFQETYCSLVVKQEDLLIIPDTTAHSKTSDLKITSEIGSTVFIGVPIYLRDGTNVGTICGMDRHSYQFSKSEMSLLKSMASFLGHVIELENIAFRDNLTQVFNREYLEVYFSKKWKDKHRSIGFLFIDFDDFKSINDTYDHSVGDHVLKAVAERIKKSVRPNDIVCRSGGDEFLALVFDYERDEILTQIIEKIQKELSMPVKIEANDIPISISMGISRYPEDGTDVLDLVKMADRAMYSVKKNGKNNHSFHLSE